MEPLAIQLPAMKCKRAGTKAPPRFANGCYIFLHWRSSQRAMNTFPFSHIIR